MQDQVYISLLIKCFSYLTPRLWVDLVCRGFGRRVPETEVGLVRGHLLIDSWIYFRTYFNWFLDFFTLTCSRLNAAELINWNISQNIWRGPSFWEYNQCFCSPITSPTKEELSYSTQFKKLNFWGSIFKKFFSWLLENTHSKYDSWGLLSSMYPPFGKKNLVEVSGVKKLMSFTRHRGWYKDGLKSCGFTSHTSGC